MAKQVGAQELYLWAGLLLLGAGGWQIHRSLGFGVPGVIIVWFSMPSRPPFVVSAPSGRWKRSNHEEPA